MARAAYSGRDRVPVPITGDGPLRPTPSKACTTAFAESVIEPFNVTPTKSRHKYLAQSMTSGDRPSYSRSAAKLASVLVIWTSSALLLLFLTLA